MNAQYCLGLIHGLGLAIAGYAAFFAVRTLISVRRNERELAAAERLEAEWRAEVLKARQGWVDYNREMLARFEARFSAELKGKAHENNKNN